MWYVRTSKLLFSMVQRYKFESKSQHTMKNIEKILCCFQWSKDTNLKANHNLICLSCCITVLFSMVQRYKFESKSQHMKKMMYLMGCCFQWSKDTNLKANHNVITVSWKNPALFSMVQRYKFESKSQQSRGTYVKPGSCFQWSKDTNLKANHNGFLPFHLKM